MIQPFVRRVGIDVMDVTDPPKRGASFFPLLLLSAGLEFSKTKRGIMMSIHGNCSSRILIAILLSLLPAAGCGPQIQYMALDPDMKTVDIRTKSIAIFTVTIQNQFKPDYPVSPAEVVVPYNGTETPFCLSGDWDGHGDTIHKGLAFSGNSSGDSPVSLALPPGIHTIGNIGGAGMKTVFIMWQYSFPLNAEFDLPPNSVVYLGHVVMTNRERKDNEPPSGPMSSPANGLIVSPVEQSVSGMYAGTTVITITDQSDQDIPKFLAKYPCLRGVDIKKAIMTKMAAKP